MSWPRRRCHNVIGCIRRAVFVEVTATIVFFSVTRARVSTNTATVTGTVVVRIRNVVGDGGVGDRHRPAGVIKPPPLPAAELPLIVVLMSVKLVRLRWC